MKAITLKRLNEVIEADIPVGFCLNCGRRVLHVQQNEKERGCYHCGKFRVFGARYIRKMKWFSSS